MLRYKTSDNAIQITVTTTATTLQDLLNTANWSVLNLDTSINAIEIDCQDNIRYSCSWTPTATKWMRVMKDETRIFHWISLDQIKLISATGSSVLVNVEVWKTI